MSIVMSIVILIVILIDMIIDMIILMAISMLIHMFILMLILILILISITLFFTTLMPIAFPILLLIILFILIIAINALIQACRFYSGGHGTAQEFIARWTKFFNEETYDRFELHRGLNNCFSHDICPPIPVLESALRACRRHNDFATAVRIFGGVKEKLAKKHQYDEYVAHLRPLMDELGVCTPEELGRDD